MTQHRFIADAALSISRGLPLGDEPGLGELTLGGFLREVTTQYSGREALVYARPDGMIERWSYADLWREANAVAKALVVGGFHTGNESACS